MSGEHHIQSERQNRWIGGGVTLVFHLLVLFSFVTTGFRSIYPQPQAQDILVEFIPEPTPVIPQAIPNVEPRSPDPDPDSDVRLVQQAINTEVVPGEERTQERTLGETGDVEVHEPPPPKPINERALFTSRDTGDSLARQSSQTAGNTMQAGHPGGNTREGNPNGAPSATLPGRNVLGALPLPEYTTNSGGTVVVRIWVDQYGQVTNASINMTGTTVQNKTLWDAAVKAALKARFNVSANAPVVQEGAISYVFILK